MPCFHPTGNTCEGWARNVETPRTSRSPAGDTARCRPRHHITARTATATEIAASSVTTLVVRKGVPRCAARPHAIEIARGNVQTAKIRRKAAQERLALHLKSPRPVAVASPTVATTDHNGMFVLSTDDSNEDSAFSGPFVGQSDA